ncbi:MAG: NAD(P)H-binding protein [Oceanospirillaceae bacterium]|nr:NAD(P)H-binding protein [Oceanospirillaceae bacterium]
MNTAKQKTVLVLGANGGFGSHMVHELLSHGYQVKCLVRDPNKLNDSLMGIDIKVIKGDAANISEVTQAAQGCEILVYAINMPYAQWQQKSLSTLEVSVRLSEKNNMTLIFPGNVYIHNPAHGPNFSESSSHQPVTKKGKIRQAMELRLKRASHNGAKILIIRAGDFIGKNAKNTWLDFMLKKGRSGYTLSAGTKQDITHSWAYLPDVAKACIALLNAGLPKAYNDFNFAGYQISFTDIAQAIERESGKKVKMAYIPWWLFSLLAPVLPFFKELNEMRYLWEQELNLNEDKLKKVLPEFKVTPIGTALRETKLI